MQLHGKLWLKNQTKEYISSSGCNAIVQKECVLWNTNNIYIYICNYNFFKFVMYFFTEKKVIFLMIGKGYIFKLLFNCLKKKSFGFRRCGFPAVCLTLRDILEIKPDSAIQGTSITFFLCILLENVFCRSVLILVRSHCFSSSLT